METLIKWTPRPLPKLADLHHNPDEAFKDDELLRLLHQPVPATWIKKLSYVKVRVNGKSEDLQYIPIDKVKFLLTKIFGIWRREIKSVTPFFNSSLAVVRVHVRHPFTGEWLWNDGVGAAPMQTDAGATATDAHALKADAAMKAGGSSVSYALKNACECWGSIFGSNLQNADAIQFTGAYQELANNLQKAAAEGNEQAGAALSSMSLDLPIIQTEF
jgi:hypothetical protein